MFFTANHKKAQYQHHAISGWQTIFWCSVECCKGSVWANRCCVLSCTRSGFCRLCIAQSDWQGRAEFRLLWGFTEFVPPAMGLQALIESNLLFSHTACWRNLILALMHALIHLGFWYFVTHPFISPPFPSHLFTWWGNHVKEEIQLFILLLFTPTHDSQNLYEWLYSLKHKRRCITERSHCFCPHN